jgi:hypothetical protein
MIQWKRQKLYGLFLTVLLAAVLFSVFSFQVVAEEEPVIIPLTGVGGDYLVTYANEWSYKKWVTDGWIDRMAQCRDIYYDVARLSFQFPEGASRWSQVGSVLNYTAMDEVVGYFDDINMTVILAEHTIAHSAYMAEALGDYFWTETFYNDWLNLTTHYQGDNRIAGFLLSVEPHYRNLDGKSAADMVQLFANLTKAIHAIDADRLVIFPDFEFMYEYALWGSETARVQAFVSDLDDNGMFEEPKVMFDIYHPFYFESAHDMGLTVQQKLNWYFNLIDYLLNFFSSDQLYISETFAWKGKTDALQQEFLDGVISRCTSRGIAFTVFSITNGIGDWELNFPVMQAGAYPAMSENGNGGEPPPTGEGVFFSDGFESGDFSAWNGTSNSPVVASISPFKGDYHAVFTNTANFSYVLFEGVSEVFARGYFQLKALPAVDYEHVLLMRFYDGGAIRGYVGVQRHGGVQKWVMYYHNSGSSILIRSTMETPIVDAWYSVEMRIRCGSGTAEYQVWINGTELTDITQTNRDSVGSTVNRVDFGIPFEDYAGSVTVWADNCVLATEYIGLYKEPVYVLDLSIVSPGAKTYNTVSGEIPISISNLGNETGVIYSWNVYFLNGTALYMSNQTSTADTFYATVNATYIFACTATGEHDTYDYSSVQFAVNITVDEPEPTPSPEPTPTPSPPPAEEEPDPTAPPSVRQPPPPPGSGLGNVQLNTIYFLVGGLVCFVVVAVFILYVRSGKR